MELTNDSKINLKFKNFESIKLAVSSLTRESFVIVSGYHKVRINVEMSHLSDWRECDCFAQHPTTFFLPFYRVFPSSVTSNLSHCFLLKLNQHVSFSDVRFAYKIESLYPVRFKTSVFETLCLSSQFLANVCNTKVQTY